MANSWLRLWHDMPTDPKFRTVSRISGQQISLVISVYVTLLVDASRNVTRGHITVTHEDVASQLDVTEQEIKSIFDAMEGRLIEKNHLSGWDKRQPKREDSGDSETGAKSAAQRKKEQREREKLEQEAEKNNDDKKQCHETSHNVTLDKDKDKDKDIKAKSKKFNFKAELIELGVTHQHADDWLQVRKAKNAANTKTAFDAFLAEVELTGKDHDYAVRIAVENGWRGFKANWLQNIPESSSLMDGVL